MVNQSPRITTRKPKHSHETMLTLSVPGPVFFLCWVASSFSTSQEMMPSLYVQMIRNPKSCWSAREFARIYPYTVAQMLSPSLVESHVLPGNHRVCCMISQNFYEFWFQKKPSMSPYLPISAHISIVSQGTACCPAIQGFCNACPFGSSDHRGFSLSEDVPDIRREPLNNNSSWTLNIAIL